MLRTVDYSLVWIERLGRQFTRDGSGGRVGGFNANRIGAAARKTDQRFTIVRAESLRLSRVRPITFWTTFHLIHLNDRSGRGLSTGRSQLCLQLRTGRIEL